MVLIFMEILVAIIIILAVAYILSNKNVSKEETDSPKQARQFLYSRKEHIMTAAEREFFHVLADVAQGQYYVFPQIHLSALLSNETKGKYWKAAFQRVNRMSVDYVLCDIKTLQPVYAVELDDYTHDRPKRQQRDTGVEQMLYDAGIPLVRFRDYKQLSRDQIVSRFSDAKSRIPESNHETIEPIHAGK